MKRLLVILSLWRHDRRGVTAVEYGLIAAGIAVAISGAIVLFGDNLAQLFDDSANMVAQRA